MLKCRGIYLTFWATFDTWIISWMLRLSSLNSEPCVFTDLYVSGVQHCLPIVGTQ